MMFDQQVTFIYTKDLENSAAFYHDTLEFEQVLDQGTCRIFRVSPNSFLGVCRCSENRPVSPEGIVITLVTREVDKIFQMLKSKGVGFDHPPKNNQEYNIRHCFFNDPDGYKLEIQQFFDPAWPKA